MTGALGPVVGKCRTCGSTVRAKYVTKEMAVFKDGKKPILIHTALRQLRPQDPPRPCRGAVVPDPDRKTPPPQFSIDAWRPENQ